MSYDNPSYYKGKYGLEAIEVIKNFFEDNAYLGTVFPYLARLGKKDSAIQDLDKSIWWLTTYRKHLVDTGTYDPKMDKGLFPAIRAEKTTEEKADDPAVGKEMPKLFIGLLPQTLISGTFNRLGMASGTLVNQNGAFGIDGKGKYFGGKVGVSTGAANNLRDQVLASDMITAVIDEDNTILYDAIVNLPNGVYITFGGECYEKIDGVFTYTHTNPEGDKHIQPKDMLNAIVKAGSSASVDYGSIVDYFSLSGIDALTESERVALLDALPNSTRLYCDGWCGEYNYIKFGMGWLPSDSMTFVTSEDIAISAEALTKLNTPKAILAAIEALPEGVRVKRTDNPKDYIEIHKHEGQTIMRKHDNDMFRSLDEMLQDLLMLNHEYRIFRNPTDS